jgi:hypothetical protein
MVLVLLVLLTNGSPTVSGTWQLAGDGQETAELRRWNMRKRTVRLVHRLAALGTPAEWLADAFNLPLERVRQLAQQDPDEDREPRAPDVEPCPTEAADHRWYGDE